LSEKGKDLERKLDSIREKTERLQGELEEAEAIELLEETVEELERFGGELEERGSERDTSSG
jgi:hypothetical protein